MTRPPPPPAHAGKPASSSVEKPETGTRLSAGEIHDNVMSEADEELNRATASLFLSSLASGLAIGFSFLGGAYLSSLVAPAYAASCSSSWPGANSSPKTR